jgi:hypothetical protein
MYTRLGYRTFKQTSKETVSTCRKTHHPVLMVSLLIRGSAAQQQGGLTE